MIFCETCKSKIRVPFEYIGLSYLCPFCGSMQKTGIESQSNFRNTGYEITYLDFLRLVEDKKNNKEIITTIEKKFNCKLIELENLKTAFLSKENEFIPFEFIHIAIQKDKKTQKSIYQLAMSIWRKRENTNAQHELIKKELKEF
jgi:hypothetical protein